MSEFATDWDEWNGQWRQWLNGHRHRMTSVPKAIPGKNFLADDIIGTYRVGGRIVELSEVVFPNLSERDPATGRLLEGRVRAIGLTFADDRSGNVVHSFSELEQSLWPTTAEGGTN